MINFLLYCVLWHKYMLRVLLVVIVVKQVDLSLTLYTTSLSERSLLDHDLQAVSAIIFDCTYVIFNHLPIELTPIMVTANVSIVQHL